MAGKEEGSMEAALGETKLPAASVLTKQATATTAAAASGGKKSKRRLKKSEIRNIIVRKPESFPDAGYLDELAKYESPEWIAERKRQHEEDAAYFGKVDEEYEEFRQQVIKGVKEKGYFEVVDDEEEYRRVDREEASEEYTRQDWPKADVSKLLRFVATPEEEEERRRDGYGAYVPDEDDAVLDGIPSDDDNDFF